MGNFVQLIFNLPIIRWVTKPFTRFAIKLIAIPIFRFLLRYLFRVEVISQELEKDLAQWFRASVLLLIATHNMEPVLFGANPVTYKHENEWDAMLFGLRLLLAIGCIESMPDQELFRLIHSGPPKLQGAGFFAKLGDLGRKWRAWLWGLVCIHLSRSSPVFVIVSVIHTGRAGWVCYAIGIVQYLVIGLCTSRDKALNVLTAFDAEIAARRKELLAELPVSGPPAMKASATVVDAPRANAT